MKISLMVLSAGAAAGKTLPINAAQFLIGRDPQCNLRPASAMISKRHCAVLVKDDKVFIRDFDSTNGTFLNDEQIKGEVEVKDGDTLKLGPLSFKVVVEAGGVPTKPTPPPKAKSAAENDEDAAAALLSIDGEDGGVEIRNADSVEGEIPGGSTVMDLPAFGPGEESVKEPETKDDQGDKAAAAAAPAAAPAKPEGKKKNESGAAQNAAKALLERMRQGKRK